MSGFSENIACPRCGSIDTFEYSVDLYTISGLCTECGYSVQTKQTVLTLGETNKEREYVELPPLTELKKPLPDWSNDNEEQNEE